MSPSKRPKAAFGRWPTAALPAFLVVAVAFVACRDITAPAGATPGAPSRLLNPVGAVVVTPANMHGWVFYNDQRDTACADALACRMVQGPSGQPLGAGSAELAATLATDGKALLLADYKGLRFDSVTTLEYSTYRQSVDAGNNLAIALQVNVDYDLTDAATGYQGRLVYEPYHAAGGGVPQGAWQTWDAKAGKWWGTKASVPRLGVLVANPCVHASPCTWAELLAAFPNVGIHATYGAVVLKAGSGWTGFRGNVDNLSIGVRSSTTTFNFELNEAPLVPALPPDSIPAIVEDSTRFVPLATDPSGDMRVHRSVLSIEFEDSVSQATRSAIIASIGGEVIGGEPDESGDGPYYVQVPDDPTGEVNLQVGYELSKRPTIVSAYPPTRVPTSTMLGYRRPKEKAGSGWNEWELDPLKTTTARRNWALEMIRAPFAWGCDVGSTSTKVAVLDASFHTDSQLGANLVSTQVRNLMPAIGNQPLSWHGDAVSELLAARGNDSSGMAGVMWRAALAQYEISELNSGPGGPSYKLYRGLPYSTPRSAKAGLIAAARGGARVINISTYVAGNAVPTTPADSARLMPWANELAAGMRTIEKQGLRMPLLVIIAGNNGIDAGASALPLLATNKRYGKYVIVVGAAQFGVTKVVSASAFSGTGKLVDIFAPGSELFGIDPFGADQRIGGTSVAAPLVSGVAGLLFSADPALDAATVKQLILSGATNSGRTAVDAAGKSYPLLDAYEALKASAARPGAPLCGNRVWNDGVNNIYVERGNGQESVISRSSDDYAAYVQAYHGGKRIDLGFSYSYIWNSTTRRFEEQPYVDAPFSETSGAWLSYTYVSDHDNTMWAQRSDTADGAGQQSRVKLNSNVGKPTIDLGALHIPGTAPSPPGRVCIMEYPVDTAGNPQMYLRPQDFSGSWQCMGYGPAGAWDSAPENSPPLGTRNETPILASPAPQGNAIYVPVNVRHISIQWSPLAEGCNQIDTDSAFRAQNSAYTIIRRCANKTVDTDSAVRAMVYRIDTATKVWTAIPLTAGGQTALQNREINSLEVSEDGREIMISSTRRAAYGEFDLSLACHDEQLIWISVDQGVNPRFAPGTPIKTVDVPQGAACGGWVEAGGTVSPTRIPAHMPTLPGIGSNGSRPELLYVPLRQMPRHPKGGAGIRR